MLDRCWLTNHGPLVEELEAEIARRVGVRHCIATCNGASRWKSRCARRA
jgi:dTDP-4-amino-4,6-dideoxygalactose transaminase